MNKPVYIFDQVQHMFYTTLKYQSSFHERDVRYRVS